MHFCHWETQIVVLYACTSQKTKTLIQLSFLRVRGAVLPYVLQSLPLKTWPVVRNT